MATSFPYDLTSASSRADPGTLRSHKVEDGIGRTSRPQSLKKKLSRRLSSASLKSKHASRPNPAGYVRANSTVSAPAADNDAFRLEISGFSHLDADSPSDCVTPELVSILQSALPQEPVQQSTSTDEDLSSSHRGRLSTPSWDSGCSHYPLSLSSSLSADSSKSQSQLHAHLATPTEANQVSGAEWEILASLQAQQEDFHRHLAEVILHRQQQHLARLSILVENHLDQFLKTLHAQLGNVLDKESCPQERDERSDTPVSTVPPPAPAPSRIPSSYFLEQFRGRSVSASTSMFLSSSSLASSCSPALNGAAPQSVYGQRTHHSMAHSDQPPNTPEPTHSSLQSLSPSEADELEQAFEDCKHYSQDTAH